MTAILVVNADDFGLTEGNNRAIVDAHRTGIVTSTSLLANGLAFDHAVSLWRDVPSLGVGVHLTLTEGPPVARDVDILLADNGELPLSNQPFVRALLTGKLPRAMIRREFEAQVRKVIEAGIQPTHLDGHKYIHLLPGITAIAIEIARQLAIPVVRVPHGFIDRPSSIKLKRYIGLMILAGMSRLAYRAIRKTGLKSSEHFAGFMDTGHLDQDIIRRLLARPRPGVTELLCHPAYPNPDLNVLHYAWIGTYQFAQETTAVSDPVLRRDLQAAGWIFRHFGTL